MVSVFTIGTGVASADAGQGIGLTNITTNGFTPPWQGGWTAHRTPRRLARTGLRERLKG